MTGIAAPLSFLERVQSLKLLKSGPRQGFAPLIVSLHEKSWAELHEVHYLLGLIMQRSVETVIGSLLAIIAGVCIFILVLIVTGVGPGWPRIPRRTTATVLTIDRESASTHSPRYRYVATVRWTNVEGAVIQQRDAWGRVRPDLSEGATLPAVTFQQTADPKTRSSSGRIGLGSVRDYWLRQGLWDWAAFWGPILAVVPATLGAYVLLRSRSRVETDRAT